MFSTLGSATRLLIPVDPRMAVIGLGVGMSTGAVELLLGRSVDDAIGVGLMFSLATTVGSFLGIRLFYLVMRGFMLWVNSISARQEILGERIHSMVGEPKERNDRAESQEKTGKVTPWFTWLITSTVVGVSLIPAASVGLLAQQVADPEGTYKFGVVLGVGCALAFVGIAGHAAHMWTISRTLSTLESQFETISGMEIAPITARPKAVERTIQSVQDWVCRLTGVCENPRGRAVVR